MEEKENRARSLKPPGKTCLQACRANSARRGRGRTPSDCHPTWWNRSGGGHLLLSLAAAGSESRRGCREAKASLRSCLSSHAKVRAELHHSVRNYKDRWDVNIKNYSKYPYISRHSGALYSYVGTSTCRYINIKQDLRQDLSRDSNAAFAKTARPAAHTAAACTRATSRGGARFHGGAGGAVSLAVSARCRMATSTDAMTENGCTTAAARPGQSAPAT